MIKYAVKYLKNTFVPLKGVNINEEDCNSDLDNKLVLVRTEKGEEVLSKLMNRKLKEEENYDKVRS